ncbi:uncharacterized protein LOC142767347 [Rhipicephalus microplus]|uniref:uncharacterized protein LOC142767347 n=1 Tax=Rhipicephalus microplus TaxID=6941 RepID=UPI003F6DA025
MLTVPPLPRYVAPYGLDPLLALVEHVVLATHKLRPRRSSVHCSGARLYAAPAFREIRDSFGAAHRRKFAYSVSVAAYAGPKQLQERMHRSYEDDMGDAAVAVYDAFLDDFAGLCPGESRRMSPQLASIAESTTRVLLQ